MGITFGEWVRSKRGEEGEPGFITQQELADRIGINRTRVIQIEKSRKLPKYDTRQRIHAALGSSEEELRALGIIRDRSASSGPTAPRSIEEGRPPGYLARDALAELASPLSNAIRPRKKCGA